MVDPYAEQSILVAAVGLYISPFPRAHYQRVWVDFRLGCQVGVTSEADASEVILDNALTTIYLIDKAGCIGKHTVSTINFGESQRVCTDN